MYHPNVCTRAFALILFLSLSPFVFTQQPLKTFLWDQGNNGSGFWNRMINCGDPNQPGGIGNTQGSKITFGTDKEQRFPGTFSVELWTNSEFEESCNQNFSAERAEISVSKTYRDLGAKEGATVWFGWSEKYTDIDRSHTSTLMQFRNQCGSGSPKTAIVYRREGRDYGGALNGISLHAGEGTGYGVDGKIYGNKHVVVIPAKELKEGTWYDWVVEVKLSRKNDGYIRVWVATSGTDGDVTLNYGQPTAAIENATTMNDDCPHIRWGVYRHESADKKPSQIKPEDHLMIKYVGPTRFHIGNDLKEEGFNLVVPRSPEEPDEQESVKAHLKISLEGFISGANGEMHTLLNEKGLIPQNQPFNIAPFNYSGKEKITDEDASIVDWVLVEVSSSEYPDSMLARKAALLTSRGLIKEVDQNEYLHFNHLEEASYIVRVFHKSHLAVMSSSAVPFTTQDPILYDFTSAANQASGNNQQKWVDDVFALFGGDFDQNGIINNIDFNLWSERAASINEYLKIDVDGNGIINNRDFNFWNTNRSKIGILGLTD